VAVWGGFILFVLPAAVWAETQFVPLISVRERYDTNVLFVNPKLVPGVNVEDFVTTITPQLIMKSRGGAIDINGSGGVIGEIYKNNPSLNYVGFNAALGLGLTPLVTRVLPRATMDIVGSYQYTPRPPAFLPGSQQSQEQLDPFLRGIQVFRANTRRYMVGQRAAYRVTPTVSIAESYTYSKFTFGSQLPGTTGLLDTSSHLFSLAPTIRISAADVVSNTYTVSAYDQSGIGSFQTYASTVGWSRSWSDTLFTQAAGGVQLLSSAFSAAGSGTGTSVQNPLILTPTGTFSMTYSSHTRVLGEFAETAGQLTGLPQLAGSIMPGGGGPAGSYSLRVSYSYGAFPLLLAGGGLAKSHVFGLHGTLNVTPSMTIIYGGNFGRNDATGAAQQFSFESISANGGFNYRITPALQAGLTYTYTNSYGLGNQGSSSPGQNVTNFLTYSRQVVMLNLVYAFGGGSQFFQGESFFGSSGGAGMGPSTGGR